MTENSHIEWCDHTINFMIGKHLESGEKKTSVWGNQQFGGYAGVKHTAKQIMSCIPDSKIYVEPFAGMARTCDESKHDKVILNDMSDYAVNYLKENFKKSIITQMDFQECVEKWDSEDTFFLFDPPWENDVYKQNTNTYCNMRPSQYYKKLLEIVKTMKGDWMILSTLNPSRWQFKTSYFEKHIVSDKNVLFGKKAKTRVTSNIPIISRHGVQLCLDVESD